jgi:hypothetical protein
LRSSVLRRAPYYLFGRHLVRRNARSSNDQPTGSRVNLDCCAWQFRSRPPFQLRDCPGDHPVGDFFGADFEEENAHEDSESPGLRHGVISPRVNAGSVAEAVAAG